MWLPVQASLPVHNSVQDKKKLFKLRYCQTTTEAFINQTKLKSGIHDLTERIKRKMSLPFQIGRG